MPSVEFHKFRENIKNIDDFTDQKEKIFDNFMDQGLPNKRNESWKYFDLVSKSKKYIKNDISNSEIIVENLEEKNVFLWICVNYGILLKFKLSFILETSLHF